MSLNICYAADHMYAPIAAVSMQSLFMNGINDPQPKPDNNICIFFLDCGLTEDDRHRLKQQAENHSAELSFYEVVEILEEVKTMGFPPFRGNYSAYSRLLIGYLIPSDIQKILYLDCDTLIYDDISIFYDSDMNDQVCMGAQDIIGSDYYTQNGISETFEYINSGVLLINMDRWREYYIGDKVNKLVKTIIQCKYADQDIINYMNYNIQREGGGADLRFNVITPYLEWNYSCLKKIYPSVKKLRYSEQDIEEAILHPAIIHMVDGMCGRPWEKGNFNKLNEKWHSLLMQTEFSDGWKDFNIEETIPHKLMRIIYRVVPQVISSSLYVWNHKRKRFIL